MYNTCLIGHGYWGEKLARNFNSSEFFDNRISRFFSLVSSFWLSIFISLFVIVDFCDSLCGSYFVSLEVEDGHGCKDETDGTDIAIVNCNPTANFSAPDVCFGTPTDFDAATPPNNSIPIPGSNIINHTWSSALIPGAGTPTGISPTFQWPFSAGTHSVTLMIQDDQSPSCSGSIQKDVVVNL